MIGRFLMGHTRAETPERNLRSTRRGIVAIVATTALVVTGWGNSAPVSAAGGNPGLHAMLPKAIQQSGKIIDIINSPYAPMEFSPPGSSNFTGFDIDMARAVARKLGVSLQLENVQFPQVIPSITTHRGDMAWTAVLDLKKRHGALSFIDYFKTGAQLYTSAANRSKYRAVSDLCGQSVVVPSGTNYAQIIQGLSGTRCRGRGSISVLQVTSTAEQQLQIKEGRAAAAMIGVETILDTMRHNRGQWSLIGKIFEPDYYGIVFARNGGQLLNAVHAALQAAVRDGTYHRLLVKWGLARSGLARPLVNAARH